MQRNSLLLSAVILALGAGSAYGQAESTSDEIETPAAQSQSTTETQTRATESQDAESAPDADVSVTEPQAIEPATDADTTLMESEEPPATAPEPTADDLSSDATEPAERATPSPLASMTTDDVVEKPVTDETGEEVGQLEAVVIDFSPEGNGYAVVKYGGFLGLGEKEILVDLNDLELSANGVIQVPAPEGEFRSAFMPFQEGKYQHYQGELAPLLAQPSA